MRIRPLLLGCALGLFGCAHSEELAQKNRAIEKLRADLMVAEKQIGDDQEQFIQARREVDQCAKQSAGSPATAKP